MPARRRKRVPPAATLSRLRALADPLRFRIFENLLAEPRTAKQMAQHIGTQPTRLYHHFRVLEKVGLIQAAGTRQKRGTVEKYFKAAIDRIEVGGTSLGSAGGVVPALIEGALGSTLADMRHAGTPRTTRSREPRACLKRYLIRATPEQATEIHARLEAIAELCEQASADAGEKVFGVTLAFYESPAARKRRRKR